MENVPPKCLSFWWIVDKMACRLKVSSWTFNKHLWRSRNSVHSCPFQTTTTTFLHESWCKADEQWELHLEHHCAWISFGRQSSTLLKIESIGHRFCRIAQKVERFMQAIKKAQRNGTLRYKINKYVALTLMLKSTLNWGISGYITHIIHIKWRSFWKQWFWNDQPIKKLREWLFYNKSKLSCIIQYFLEHMWQEQRDLTNIYILYPLHILAMIYLSIFRWETGVYITGQYECYKSQGEHRKWLTNTVKILFCWCLTVDLSEMW